MTTITIPQNLLKEKELLLVPRKRYEEFSIWEKTMRLWKEFEPTPAQKRALKQGRVNRAKGNSLTLNELKQKLDFTG